MKSEPDMPLSAPGKSGRTDIDTRLHFAALVNSSNDPILTKDLDGRILSWNRAAARVFGYEENEIVGESILRLIPSDFHQAENELLRRLKVGETIDPYETTWTRKDGADIPVLVTVYHVRNETGDVIGASKIACDLSERKRNDESRFRLAAIVDSADDAIVSKDLNGIISTWNEGAHRMFGYSAEEIIGQSILRIVPDELRHEEDEILRKLRAGERIDHYETTRRKKSGESVDVSVTISPIRNGAGQVTGASKIARDISDRKRIERLLIQSEKLAATGRMAATIAHEINNPLESVMNLIYLARQHSVVEGKVHQYLVTAEEELERVSHIARQTLGYYKDTGSPSEVALHALIENVLAVYNSRLTALGISVDLQFNDLQKIVVSKGEMLQVLSNIIANAIDSMRDGGSLKISTRKVLGSSGDGIQTVIRDSGTGIKQEHLERIFEPFFTTKGDLGTGIGLWVARQLVERRGGQISVASSTEKESSGTTITIFLPLAFPISRLTTEQ
ncbi:PAS domain-containing sensor histidine kinase [Granulicella sp. L60]|uniref:PAS domain-containing sensor histidine kinase n=1 Tax=Granulicella sp. L60 TaxID=1641866 RepID=UPI0020B10FBA|nr:PAS domain-containing sensor histidine kinase [Granulicella sp. L60]